MRRRIGLFAASLLLVAAALAGCGGGSSGDRGMMDGTGGAMHTGPDEGAARSDGRVLFRADCGGCHTLAAAGTTGSVGPDLDQARPTYDHVLRVVTDGEGAMPAFARSLTRSQIEAIARYVSNATP